MAPVAPPPAAPMRPAPIAGPTIEQRLAELERRSMQLMESVLDIMRGQAEELTRNCLEEFRQQVDALIQDAQGRLRQALQQGYEESAASLIGLRSDLMEQMASRGAQMLRSTEDTLRTRLRNQSAAEDKTLPVKPSESVTEK
jgi:exonuclease VII large subunit